MISLTYSYTEGFVYTLLFMLAGGAAIVDGAIMLLSFGQLSSNFEFRIRCFMVKRQLRKKIEANKS